MITIRPHDERGHANHGWLDTWHSFSFNTYHDPRHVQFGPLRVLNEDFVAPAGSGVVHSEFNPSETEPLHLLQIWILPDARGRTPRYGQKRFDRAARKNVLLPVVAGHDGNSALPIHQDAALYVSELDAGRSVTHVLAPGRRTYVFVTAGELLVNGRRLGPSDAAAVEAETELELKSSAPSAFVLLDLP